MFPTWWRSLVKLVHRNGKPHRRGRRKTGQPRAKWHPLLEQFEDRLVPTKLFIPTTLVGAQNGIVSVPVNVDTLHDGSQSGLTGANFVIYYDQNSFTVGNSDVRLGSVDPAAAGF